MIAFKGPSVFLVNSRVVTRSESQKYCCLLPKKFCKQGFPRHRADWLHPSGRIYSLVCLLLGACGGEGGSYLTKELKSTGLFVFQTCFTVFLFIFVSDFDIGLPWLAFCFLKCNAPFQVSLLNAFLPEEKQCSSVLEGLLQ